jgi:predicted phosphoribosyltransferase
MSVTFADREAAGRALAERLTQYRDRTDVIVLGLPRGGVPVAAQVATALNAPLDVYVVRKLGVPGRPELALGAIGPGGVRVLNQDVIQAYGLRPEDVDPVVERESAELVRREKEYRGDADPLVLAARTVILVDDGLATGASMRAAVQAVRHADPARVIVAVPVAASTVGSDLELIADEVVCVQTPSFFMAVGQWYDDFSQTSDAEVRDLLRH